MEEWAGSRTDGYWEALNVCCAAREVVLVYNGNQIYGDFLIEGHEPFDVIDDDRPFDLAEPGRLYVRKSCCASFCILPCSKIGTIVENAIRPVRGRVLVTGSPAPVRGLPAGFAIGKGKRVLDRPDRKPKPEYRRYSAHPAPGHENHMGHPAGVDAGGDGGCGRRIRAGAGGDPIAGRLQVA